MNGLTYVAVCENCETYVQSGSKRELDLKKRYLMGCEATGLITLKNLLEATLH